MGYGVYWKNGRWQGYGVPAYCDFPGCKEKIDRGLGYQNNQDKEDGENNFFCCSKHQFAPVEPLSIDNDKEHLEWLKHVLKDETWREWRMENKDIVNKYKSILLKELEID